MHARILTLSAFVALAAAYPFQLQTRWTSGTGDEENVYCIVASEDRDGAPVVIQECSTAAYDNRAWRVALPDKFEAGPAPIAIFENKCLDVTGGDKVDGTKLQIWTCDSVNPNQQWISTTANTFRSVESNKCIDITDGSTTNGNQLQIWECGNNNSNQRFFGITAEGTAHTVYIEAGEPDPKLEVDRPVMVATANADGAPVALATHNNFTELYPDGNQTWVMQDYPWSGPIRTYDGSKCLDVPNGNDANGQKVQIWSCVEGSANQQWVKTPSGSLIQWFGHNKCLDITDGKQEPGTEVRLFVRCGSSSRRLT
ncbi:hypothetical protein VNI00_007122 [Paramarasmius palmivorus]|uniref:Ricin B lectin domain-containing protein n=1 Tax=Paramarasmius palmivorus TaxID=297713 RepID=A0AAW0D460_9AGAR